MCLASKCDADKLHVLYFRHRVLKAQCKNTGSPTTGYGSCVALSILVQIHKVTAGDYTLCNRSRVDVSENGRKTIS